jgi:hypothetical protein
MYLTMPKHSYKNSLWFGGGIGSFHSLRITTVSHIEFTRVQFSYRIVPRQAVKHFTSTCCLYFRNELKLLYMPEQTHIIGATIYGLLLCMILNTINVIIYSITDRHIHFKLFQNKITIDVDL